MGGRRHWLIWMAALLVLLAAALHLLHYAIFRDWHHIFIYLLGDVAFLPLEVLFVVIVIERVLARHEKSLMLEKMNMPIGTFFSELGTALLGRLTQCVQNREELRPHLAVGKDWTERDFRRAIAFVGRFDYKADASLLDLGGLRDELVAHRGMLLSLLANPNLLEHEQFTDLLWAVFHLMEELCARRSLEGLPASDLEHLSGDVERAYAHLTVQWLRYCGHLRTAYPYIFSIIVRTHPLQDRPDATVR